MAYAGVLGDIRKAVAMERPTGLPVFLCSEEADVRLCGSRYDRYNSDATEMARVQIAAIERFDYDWAWLQVDDCIEFEPLGVGVEGGGDILPATCRYLPATDAALTALRQHGYRVAGRMAVLLDAIGRVKAYFGDRVCVTGRVAAPFSSVTLAFGIAETMLLLYDRPDFVRDALKVMEEYQARFALDQIAAGADALWVGDCNASGHLISPDLYRDFAKEAACRLSRTCRSAGGEVIYHASEERPAMLDLQAEAGFSVLSVGPGLPLETARRTVGQRVCLCGNVDPIAVLSRGTPDQVREAVEQTVATVSRQGGHILNSGEMVPRDTPDANLLAFVEAGRRAWRRATACA
jgi:MtaA/CmuA family methyltransferase